MRSRSVALAGVVALALFAGGCGEDDISGVVPPLPTPADLSGFTISTGTLSPSFSPGNTAYIIGPGIVPSSITVTPTAAESGATIHVNGTLVASGAESPPIDLAVRMNGITVLVTAPGGMMVKGYAIIVFRSGPQAQEAYLKASNTANRDEFGSAVAISGDTIVVGTPYQAANSSAAYVFARTGGAWSQQAYLKASNTAAFDSFGHAVAVDGDTIVVRAWHESSNATGVNGDQNNNALDAGAVYVFR